MIRTSSQGRTSSQDRSSNFGLLLRSLSEEHYKQVNKLNAEVTRLRKLTSRLSSSPLRSSAGTRSNDTFGEDSVFVSSVGDSHLRSVGGDYQSNLSFPLVPKPRIEAMADDPSEDDVTLTPVRSKESTLSRIEEVSREVRGNEALHGVIKVQPVGRMNQVSQSKPRPQSIGSKPSDHYGSMPPIGERLAYEDLVSLSFETGRESDYHSTPRSYDPTIDKKEILRDKAKKSVMQQRDEEAAQKRASQEKVSKASFPIDSPSLRGWDALITAVKMRLASADLPQLHNVWNEASIASSGALALQLDALIAQNKNKFKGKKLHGSTVALNSLVSREGWLYYAWTFCMMHPTCRRRVCWDLFGIVLLVHDLIFIPVQVFDDGTDGLPNVYDTVLSVTDVVGVLYWTMDILVSFLTGFYSAEGFVELQPSKVARHYAKTWLPMDITIVTTDWSAMILGMGNSASGFMRLGKTVSRFMRCLRLLRFLKMNNAIKELMERINSEYVLQVVGLLKTLVIIVVINHYIACAWYGLGAMGFVGKRWTDKFLVNYPENFGYAYTTSLHWSLTQFTPASMEVVPQNVWERVFVVCVIILALVAFSSFVSSITAAMTHIRQINAQKVALESKVRQFFSEHKISHAMASRVWHFLRTNKLNTTRRLKETDIPAFKALPLKIREDLRLEVFAPCLSEHPLFNMIGRKHSEVMLQLCNEAIEEVILAAGEILYKGLAFVKEMLFVTFGTLEFHVMGGGDDKLELVPGQWACEASLWAETAGLSGASFAAMGGPAEVLLVDGDKFRQVILQHRKVTFFMAKYAEIFMTGYNEMMVSAGFEYTPDDEVDTLFNDNDRLKDYVARAAHLARSSGSDHRKSTTVTGRTRLHSASSGDGGFGPSGTNRGTRSDAPLGSYFVGFRGRGMSDTNSSNRHRSDSFL